MGRAWFIFAAVVALGAAHMYRFEPMENSEGFPPGAQGMPVWDRWLHRGCLSFFATEGVQRLCSAADLKAIEPR